MVWSSESRQSRGYGAEWDKLRAKVMVRDRGLCQPCLRDGRVTIAKAVDHIVSKAKAKVAGWSEAQTDAPANLQAICGPCHDRKTVEEQGRKYLPKVRYGLDGWPIE